MTSSAGDFVDQFRRGLEEEMVRRWLTSSLAEFMEAHHADLVPMLGHPRLKWEAAADLFGRQGYRDRDGNAPTAETTRETWQRVEARRQAGLKLRKDQV